MELLSKYDMNGLIGCNSTNQIDFNIVKSHNLIRIVDMFGRENTRNIYYPLLYIYDDGRVEKKIIFE